MYVFCAAYHGKIGLCWKMPVLLRAQILFGLFAVVLRSYGTNILAIRAYDKHRTESVKYCLQNASCSVCFCMNCYKCCCMAAGLCQEPRCCQRAAAPGQQRGPAAPPPPCPTCSTMALTYKRPTQCSPLLGLSAPLSHSPLGQTPLPQIPPL